MRDACGAELAISGLEDLIEIAIPVQRSAYTEAQWERIAHPLSAEEDCAYVPVIKPPAPPSAPPHPPHNGSAASPPPPPPAPWPWRAGHPPPPTPPPSADADSDANGTLSTSDPGSGPAPCVWLEGGCLSDADCGGHGDCVRGVCECDGGHLGANCSVVATCLFWDGTPPDGGAGAWSERGCVKADTPTRRTDGFVHCRCNHLTDFGGVALPTSADELLDEFTSLKFNTFTLDELVGAFGAPDLAANPTVYTFVFSCSFLNALTLLFATFRLHRRVLNHARAKHVARRQRQAEAKQAKREQKSAARLEAEAARVAKAARASGSVAAGGPQKWGLARRAIASAQSSLGIEQEHGVALGTVAVRVLRAHGLMAADRRGPNSNGTSDPYVVVQCTSGAKGKTTVKKATLEPEWDETLELSIYDKDIADANEASERRCRATLSLELWDHDTVRSLVISPLL